jgi:outer membrane lipoprotein-sorting protein
MLATTMVGFSAAVWSAADSPAGTSASAPGGMSATQIADRNIAARGGLQAWRALQTQTIAGHMDAGSGDSYARSLRAAGGTSGASVKAQRAAAAAANGKSGADQVQLPFRMELKRPNKSRLEIDFAGKTALQVYDGKNGWKVRPFLNRDDVEPFTEQEAKAQSTVEDMRGPLIDYAAQGTKVEFERTEAVEGHDAYKLKLTTKTGDVKHVWVDTKSFLDVKVEGIPRKFDGRMHNVSIYQRDFRNVSGMMMPFAYETALEGVPQTHKMTFDSVKVNLPIDDSRFAKPQPPAPSSASPPKPAAPAAR